MSTKTDKLKSKDEKSIEAVGASTNGTHPKIDRVERSALKAKAERSLLRAWKMVYEKRKEFVN